MNWINPLDKVPQVPQAWANHIVWGGAGALVLMALQLAAQRLLGRPLDLYAATLLACCLMSALSAGKKLIDFIKVGPPAERAGVCIGKAVVTVLWPWSLWAAQLPFHLTN